MTISHDTNTRFPVTDTTGFDTTTGDRTFSHAGSASAKAAVVVVCNQTVSTAVVTGVTYGGAAMTLVESRTDTTEVGRIEVYVLADQASFPTGTVDVVLQGCTASNKWATCSTMTASVGSRIKVNTQNGVNTTTSTNPTVTLTTTATSILYGAVHGGAAAPTSYAATGSETIQHNADYGALSARTARYTSETAAGTPAFAFTFATSDDWCIAAVALEEYTPPPVGDPYQRDPRWYRANIFFRPSGKAFQTLGDTTPPAAETPITLTDTAAQTDDLTVTAATPFTDTGAQTDTLAVAAAITLTDTGVETDDLTIAATVPLSDSGAETDALAVTATIDLTDTAVGADALAIDTGISQDQARPQIAGMFLVPELASFQLAGDTTVGGPTLVSLTDTGAGADALTIAAAAPLTDTAAGADTLTVTAAIPVTDAGIAADALTVAAAIPLPDTAAGADSVIVTAAVPLTDTPTANDTITVDTGATPITLTDTGAATDSLTVTVTASLTDTGTAADSVITSATVTLTDTATGADLLSVLVLIVEDPNQAWPQRFQWAFLRPNIIPFQMFGAAVALEPDPNPITLTASSGGKASVTVRPGNTRATARPSTSTTVREQH